MSPTRYRAIVAAMNQRDKTYKSNSYTNSSVIDRINFQSGGASESNGASDTNSPNFRPVLEVSPRVQVSSVVQVRRDTGWGEYMKTLAANSARYGRKNEKSRSLPSLIL